MRGPVLRRKGASRVTIGLVPARAMTDMGKQSDFPPRRLGVGPSSAFAGAVKRLSLVHPIHSEEAATMIEVRKITMAPGLSFVTSIAGSETSPLVLMLHGFCVSRHFWANQIPALAEAEYFAVAPNQRGYAAEARPDPAIFDNYGIEKLIGDALDLIAAVGRGNSRFHLVGHAGRQPLVDHR